MSTGNPSLPARGCRGWLWVLLLVLLAPLEARTQERAGAEQAEAAEDSIPGAELVVSLVTFGPGEEAWEKFGHNGLWIRDPMTGESSLYHWGLFDFQQRHFFRRFARGEMLYAMGAAPAEAYLDFYRQRGRPIAVQELNLGADEKARLQERLHWNVRPENREYRYHYFHDNCSTRLRDALDLAMGGAIRRQAERQGSGVSYRYEIRRHLAEEPLLYAGVQVLLGPGVDREITVWEEMFLPLEMKKQVRGIQVPDGEGGLMPLVKQEVSYPPGEGKWIPRVPPRRWPYFLLTGLLFGALLAWLGARGAQRRGSRRVFVTLSVLWSGLAGLLGTVLMLLWMLTAHEASYRNWNLLQVSPLSLVLAVLLLFFSCGRGRGHWVVLALAWGLVELSLLGMLAQSVSGMGQANGEVFALALPLHLGLAWGLFRCGGGRGWRFWRREEAAVAG